MRGLERNAQIGNIIGSTDPAIAVRAVLAGYAHLRINNAVLPGRIKFFQVQIGFLGFVVGVSKAVFTFILQIGLGQLGRLAIRHIFGKERDKIVLAVAGGLYVQLRRIEHINGVTQGQIALQHARAALKNRSGAITAVGNGNNLRLTQALAVNVLEVLIHQHGNSLLGVQPQEGQRHGKITPAQSRGFCFIAGSGSLFVALGA